MKDALKTIMTDFWNSKAPYTPRNKVSRELAEGKTSLVITGPRRAGKSFTLYEIRDHLATQQKDVAYVNFEDERLHGFKKEQFDLILDAYYELRRGQPVILLDEIQNVNGWGPFLRRLADNQYKVIATGSNSNMLTRDIAQKLGGRFIQLTVMPLNFAEFLQFKNVPATKEAFYSREKYAIKQCFDEYLNFGGFPEVATLTEPANKTRLLQTYFDLVFYQDLVSREKMRNEEALRHIVKKLRETLGNATAPRAIHASTKSAGISIGPNTVEKYIASLENAYVILPCLPYAKSLSRQTRKKRYFIDNGYIKLFEIKPDEGLLLENLVYTELIKYGHSPRYHQHKKECDFIISDHAIQVTREINDANKDREISGLLEAARAFKLKHATIITRDQEETLHAEGRKIQIVPAWKWMLENIQGSHALKPR